MNQSNQVVVRVNHLISEMNSVYHEASVKFGISDSVSIILYTICSMGDRCLLSDIVKLSGVSKQTINSALRKMEQDGLVLSEDFNGRKKTVCLTEAGKIMAMNTVMKLIRIENEVFSGWSELEQELYIALIQRYLNELKQKVAELNE